MGVIYYWGYTGMMEKRMETTVVGYIWISYIPI